MTGADTGAGDAAGGDAGDGGGDAGADGDGTRYGDGGPHRIPHPPRPNAPRDGAEPTPGSTADGTPGPAPAPGAGAARGHAPPSAPEASAGRLTAHVRESAPQLDHLVLKSLLGAWALAACSTAETAAVEQHLSDCGTCAEEALRLRDAVGLLRPEDSLDLDPSLRSQVLEGCMARRAPRVPVPEWAAPYDAETARLDALLRDMADAEWLAPVPLRWFDGRRQARRETTVAGVIAHLLAVDGLVATALGLPDPLDDAPGADGGTGAAPAGGPSEGALSGNPADGGDRGPVPRTEEFWRAVPEALRTPSAREPWREQGHTLVRTASFAGAGIAELDVRYGDFTLPVRDALLDRAFECWVHGEDIAEAIDYPYTVPQGAHMHRMVDLAARMLPGSIAWRRRTGLAGAPHRLTAAGAPGRTLHLEVEGDGGGDWYIPLDSPAAAAHPRDTVAYVALDRLEFCQLVAGHVPPLEAAAGHDGDREAVRDVLFAAASLSRM